MDTGLIITVCIAIVAIWGVICVGVFLYIWLWWETKSLIEEKPSSPFDHQATREEITEWLCQLIREYFEISESIHLGEETYLFYGGLNFDGVDFSELQDLLASELRQLDLCPQVDYDDDGVIETIGDFVDIIENTQPSRSQLELT